MPWNAKDKIGVERSALDLAHLVAKIRSLFKVAEIFRKKKGKHVKVCILRI